MEDKNFDFDVDVAEFETATICKDVETIGVYYKGFKFEEESKYPTAKYSFL